MDNLQKNIGNNLKSIRKGRGLSLDQAAEKTGVSKAMLGQIERGESNPTVTTLWKIATGMQVSFSTLMDEGNYDIHYVDFKELSPVVEHNGAYRVFSIFPFDPRKKFEIFTVEMDPMCEHFSEQHNEGAEEYITVNIGTLEVKIGSTSLQVTAGNSVRFAANQTHVYKNIGNEVVTFQLVMYYP